MRTGQINQPVNSDKEKSVQLNPSLFRRVFLVGKALFYAVYLHCGYVELRYLLRSRLGRARAVVLYYHRIGGRDLMTKPAEEFRRDLIYLKRKYECITLSELCRRLKGGAPLKRRMAVVTFDDGYRDNYTVAMPILQEVGIPATFFVSTGFIGTEREFPHDEEIKGLSKKPEAEQHSFLKLTWDDLRAMEKAGFEIGSHTVNHVNLGVAGQQTIERELKESLRMLNEELGERPRAFAFPWGKPENIPAAAFESMARAGYYTAVSAYGGFNARGSNPLHIQRIDAGNGRMNWLALRTRLAGLDPDYLALKLSGKAAAVGKAAAESTAGEDQPQVAVAGVRGNAGEPNKKRAIGEKISGIVA
jgi:peptidoglycan/xylan/chitin deacetylase (PgdA/CDA1 family)